MNFLILIAIIILLAFILMVFVYVIIPLAFAFGASFEATDDKTLKKMMEFAKIKKGDKVLDIGSGDGKIVIEFAKAGAIAYGYEINPFLVLISKIKIKKEGLKNRAFIRWKNFWKEDLGDFDVITVFQVGFVMPALEKKIKKEARKKMRVISNNWEFPNLKPIKKEKNIYLYEINPR